MTKHILRIILLLFLCLSLQAEMNQEVYSYDAKYKAVLNQRYLNGTCETYLEVLDAKKLNIIYEKNIFESYPTPCLKADESNAELLEATNIAWSHDSKYLSFTLRTTKTSNELKILKLKNNSFEEIAVVYPSDFDLIHCQKDRLNFVTSLAGWQQIDETEKLTINHHLGCSGSLKIFKGKVYIVTGAKETAYFEYDAKLMAESVSPDSKIRVKLTEQQSIESNECINLLTFTNTSNNSKLLEYTLYTGYPHGCSNPEAGYTGESLKNIISWNADSNTFLLFDSNLKTSNEVKIGKVITKKDKLEILILDLDLDNYFNVNCPDYISESHGWWWSLSSWTKQDQQEVIALERKFQWLTDDEKCRNQIVEVGLNNNKSKPILNCYCSNLFEKTE